MSRVPKLVFFVLFALAACSPGEVSESDKFNAYFYYPSEQSSREVYLGEVTGLGACQRSAASYASNQNMTPRSGWSYICCRIAKGSSCYSKHK
jgi:hypothetical protein